MNWVRQLLQRLQTLVHRRRNEQRLEAELQFHVDQQIAENIALGMSREEARFAALRAFGNPAVLRDKTEDTWGWIWLEQTAQNLRHSARTLARTPAFALIAVLIIAIGIGANVSLFTVVRSVLLTPLPYKDPSRLLSVYEHFPDPRMTNNVVAGGTYTEWQLENHSFSELAVALTWPRYNLSGDGGQLPERVNATEVSSNFFGTLGVQPAIGRDFSADDDQPSANATVILSWSLWKRRFGGDPGILNQTVRLDAKPYTVIGVMPASFSYPDRSIQLWTPVHHEQFELNPQRWQQLDSHMFAVVGRLKPRVTQAAATADLSAISRRLHDEHLDNPFISASATSQPLLQDMVGDIAQPLTMLFAATGCLLLIACLNVASLLVARGTARRRELAIRAALGGSRRRLFLEHLTESFVVAAAGCVVGFFMAYAAIRWFISVRPDMARVETIHIDPIVVAFAAALTFVSALFAGMISSRSVHGDQVLPALQESSRSHSSSQGRMQLRKWLLSLQVALTVVLLIGAGLLLKSYSRLRSADLGCVTNNVLTMNFSIPGAEYTQAERTVFWQSLLRRVNSLPGVTSGALGDIVPGAGYGWDNSFSFYHFTVAGQPPLPQGQGLDAIVRFADKGYFETVGIPLRRGQTFDGDQRPDHIRKAIVNESFVHHFFPNENPLGKYLLTLDHTPYEIIGVVGDTRYDVAEPPLPIMYFPMSYTTLNVATLVVRSNHDVLSLALPIQRIVQQLDPDLPVSDILTIDQIIDRSTLDANFDATLVLAFALVSLILAGVGLFGVLSYIVAQRGPEIGIRIALGAQRSQVLALMLADGLRPAGMGLLIGLAGAAAATQLIRDLLYGVQPLDAPVFAIVATMLLGVACVACLLPAWRASRLDPIRTLRNE